MKSPFYRALQIFVLVGFPLLGVLYGYQFTGQARSVVVPFQTFLFPKDKTLKQANSVSDVKIVPKDNLTIVNFWFSTCPPCVEEFPAMMELKKRAEGKGIRFIFVSVDAKWEDAVRFQANYKIKIEPENNLWDPNKEVATAWGSQKFPETYVLRRDGWVLEKIIGAQMWTRRTVLEYFLDLSEKFKDIPPMLANVQSDSPPVVKTEPKVTEPVAASKSAPESKAVPTPITKTEPESESVKSTEPKVLPVKVAASGPGEKTFYRWDAKSANLITDTASIMAIIKELGGENASEKVQLGADNEGGKYFHFIISKDKYDLLNQKMAALPLNSFIKIQNKSARVTEPGFVRIVFLVKPSK